MLICEKMCGMLPTSRLVVMISDISDVVAPRITERALRLVSYRLAGSEPLVIGVVNGSKRPASKPERGISAGRPEASSMLTVLRPFDEEPFSTIAAIPPFNDRDHLLFDSRHFLLLTHGEDHDARYRIRLRDGRHRGAKGAGGSRTCWPSRGLLELKGN